MKKLLLLAVALTISVSGFAQSTVPAYRLTPKLAPKLNLQNAVDDGKSYYSFTNQEHAKLPFGSNSRAGFSKMKFASSWNMFTLLVSEAQCLTGDYDCGIISFTHRQCASYPGNSGLVQTSFSKDGGATWDTSLIIQSDTTQHCRYPSGGIYNPPGNTDPNNAFSVIAGPITDGTSWQGNYFCSSQLDGTNNDQQFEINGGAGVFFQHMARYSFTTTPQAKAYVLGSDYDFNATTGTPPFNGLVLNTGSFNGGTNAFDWNRNKFYIAFSHDPTDNSQNWANFGSIAFNTDGTIGYIVILGRDSIFDNYSIQPLIFKTTDAGNNWIYQTPYDFSTVTGLTQYLQQTNDLSTTRPMFSAKNGIDILVDSDDHLHIVCQVNSAYSTNADSLNYFWNDSLFNQMFDVYETTTGWNAYLIDTIMTEPVYSSLSPWSYQGGIGWDGRMQASMNESRTKFFYTWLDTDPSLDQNNTFPDILGKAFNPANQTEAGTINFTANNNYHGDNFWIFVSDKVITNGSDYEVPVTTSQSQQSGNDGSGAANHYFVNGISYNDAFFYPLTTPSINKTVGFNVTQNNPNPAHGTTQFGVNLSKAASVNIEISNLLGQTVMTLPTQKCKSGMNNINLNIASLSAGVYFYTVTVGADKLTHKMIVE